MKIAVITNESLKNIKFKQIKVSAIQWLFAAALQYLRVIFIVQKLKQLDI